MATPSTMACKSTANCSIRDDEEDQHARCSESSPETGKDSDKRPLLTRKFLRAAKASSTCTVNVVTPKSLKRRTETPPRKHPPSQWSTTHEFYGPAPLTNLADPFMFFCVVTTVLTLSLEGAGRELQQAWGDVIATTCFSTENGIHIIDKSSFEKKQVIVGDDPPSDTFQCYVANGKASTAAPEIGLELFAFALIFSLTLGFPSISLIVHNKLIKMGLTHWFRHGSKVAIDIARAVHRGQQCFGLELVLCIRCSVMTEGYVRYCWLFLLLKTLVFSFPPEVAWCMISAPLARFFSAIFFPAAFIAIYAIAVFTFLPIPFDASVGTLALFPLTIYHSWGPWKALHIALKKHASTEFTPKHINSTAHAFTGDGPRIVFADLLYTTCVRIRHTDRRLVILSGFLVAAMYHWHVTTLLWALLCLPWAVVPSRPQLSQQAALTISVITVIYFLLTHPFTVVERGKVGQLELHLTAPWVMEDVRWLIGPVLIAAWTARGVHRKIARFIGMAERWSWQVVFWAVLGCAACVCDPILFAVVLQVDRFALETGGPDALRLQLGLTGAAQGADLSSLPTFEVVVASRIAIAWSIVQAIWCCTYSVAAIYLFACRALWCWVH